MKQFRESDEDEPIGQPEQKKLITDPQLVKEEWLKRESEEAWIRGILPRINPFLAMDTFKHVKRISDALATDKTAEGQALWKKYLIHFRFLFFPIKQLRTREENMARLLEFENVVGHKQLNNKFRDLVDIVHGLVREYRKGFRNSFMWFWLLGRLMAKEYAKYLNRKLHTNDTPNIAVLSKHITYSVGPNRNVFSPYEIQISVGDSVIDNVLMGYDHIVISVFLGYYVRLLTADVQYAMYRIAGPILDMVFYTRLAFYLYELPVAILAGRAAQSGQMSLIQHMLDAQKAAGDIPPYVLTRPFEESIRIVTETFPTNPEVGPGIYTGQPICSSCQNRPATLICSACQIRVFCGSAECSGNCDC